MVSQPPVTAQMEVMVLAEVVVEGATGRRGRIPVECTKMEEAVARDVEEA
jgi:hypothetical protein